MNARPIDHLVLPVAGLTAARSRLTELGFTVAPDAFHPFGTANACVFFSDGTYLEPLALANRRHAGVAAKRGNVFTARDLAFRKTSNRQGFSALVVATRDAMADHARFKMRGVSAGDVLEFSRGMTLADGSETQASFRLAFAGDDRAPEFFLFSCQRINPLPADRSGLERHANTVTGLSEIILSAPTPADFAPLVEQVLLTKAVPEAAPLQFAAANARIRILQDRELEAEFALQPTPGVEGLRGRAVIFKTADLAVTEITLAANDVAFVRREGRVLVSAAPGQGVLFGFEE
ncbi:MULTISPECIES: VOC family protein [unclassified Neorhizobium]|uniref:VOC family protein n=1 Tax=unclassified Neorhizobium TaxID=2629175 RepID=UPI001FF4892B|nr:MULTISPECIES: VOC family protein [unclassified Neorhizobium]MCJ9670128.1 VOC family protein [Neorhizobium sp. SHOUNA12B]MCJ9744571.1 VOC family protein [Neorhizobium sp. SHOUNA12A]